MRGAALGMADDKHVRVHGRKVGDGIEQGFALGVGGSADVEIDNIRGKPFSCDLKRRARARRGFKEQVEYCLAAQQRHFLDLALGDRKKGVRSVEDTHDDVARKPLDGEQMVQLAVGVELRIVGHQVRSCAGMGLTTRLKRPSAFFCSSICSLSATLTSAPRNWAAIGSSRPPRSTNAARRMRCGRP